MDAGLTASQRGLVYRAGALAPYHVASHNLTPVAVLAPEHKSLCPSVRSFASEAAGNSGVGVQAKPIKKGLSAGTVPPATEQVPPALTQKKSSLQASDPSSSPADPSSSKVPNSSATVGTDRPSAAAIPAGVDQVPPSSASQATSSQTAQGNITRDNEPSTSATSSRQSMQSVIKDIGDIGQLNQGASSNTPEASTGRWQRFRWWLWGTPQQFWTFQDNAATGSDSSQTSKSEAEGATDSSTDISGGSKRWQRSRWSIADTIASAILRSGITRDEDVARSCDPSLQLCQHGSC